MIAASSNEGVNELNQAASGARTMQGFQPMQVTADQTGGYTGDQFANRYFNPFLTQVAGNMTSEMGRARTMQIARDEDKALAAGAYGGSRHGVMDAETTRGFYDTLGKNVGDLYARGFDTAMGPPRRPGRPQGLPGRPWSSPPGTQPTRCPVTLTGMSSARNLSTSVSW